MAALKYGKYTIVSEPRFDDHLGLWTTWATVYWDRDDGLQFHRSFEIDNTFATEDEALFFGMHIARTWVDEQQE